MHFEIVAAKFARIAALVIAVAYSMTPSYATAADPEAAPSVQRTSARVVVVRRGWHIDVGFAVSELQPPLRSIAADLPKARYILFGFGDMHYLLSAHHGSSSLAAALWPGRGIMLVTGLAGTPQQAFAAQQIIELDLSPDDAHALQEWIWNAFVTQDGSASVYRPGPYEGSLYYLSNLSYSALHTCNTWAAESLKAGHFKVRSKGVLFAAQLWSQVRRLQRTERAAPSLAPAS